MFDLVEFCSVYKRARFVDLLHFKRILDHRVSFSFASMMNKDVENLIEEDIEIKILTNLKALGFFFDENDLKRDVEVGGFAS